MNERMNWGTPEEVRHLVRFLRNDREEARREWYRLRRDCPSDPRIVELEARLLEGDNK